MSRTYYAPNAQPMTISKDRRK